MRLTGALYRQHGGFMFKRHWLVQGRRIPQDTGAKTALESQGLPVIDATEYLNKRPPLERFTIERGYLPKEEVFDSTHPLWKEQKCHIFGDSNVLIEGMRQAQLLTKSAVVDGLPASVEQVIDSIKIPSRSDAFMQDAVRTSFLFDAQQEKLPIRKVPEKPAYVLPRDYGITDFRRNRLIVSKTIQECEKLAGKSIVSNRKVVQDVLFVVPIEKDGDVLQMEITADTFLTSKKPITAIATTEMIENQLPDMFPLKYTISMPQENIYQLRDIYPMSNKSGYSHPHTIFLHFSTIDVRNLHETPVTDTQFNSRSLIKAFTVAAAKARSLYGKSVDDLEKPIVVQSIQLNGQSIQFGVFQLNTLNVSGVNGTKNVWYNGPTLEMYSECLYKLGRPILAGYNPDVLRYIYGFYKTN